MGRTSQEHKKQYSPDMCNFMDQVQVYPVTFSRRRPCDVMFRDKQCDKIMYHNYLIIIIFFSDHIIEYLSIVNKFK